MNPLILDPVGISEIGRSVQLSIAPVFLLAGLGALLNVMATRLARVVDRARVLENELAGYDDGARRRALAELSTLDRRMALAHWAIYCCTASALAVCLVVVALFVGDLADTASGRVVAMLFTAAMALIIAGLVLFLSETRIATRSVRVRRELIANPDVNETPDANGG